MKLTIRYAFVAALCAAALAFSAVPASAEEEEVQGDVFTLDTCPVSGEKLGAMGDPIQYNHEGREIRFCCAGCIERFEGMADTYLSKIDKRMVRQQKPHYALSTCPVSGEKLGEMGEPLNIVVGNRLVRLCCAGCENKIREDPAQYFSKIDKAVIEKQVADYPFEKCLVSGERLGGSHGEVIDKVVANRLLRFCCAACETMFNENPAKYLNMLDTGEMEVTEGEGSHGKHEAADGH